MLSENWFWAIPTWIVTNAIAPFLPKGHPWRGRYFTLNDRAENATEFTLKIGFYVWLNVFLMTFCSVVLWASK